VESRSNIVFTVVLEKICKTYQSGETAVQALRGLDFSLSEGEFAALCGPSGSGKSTLLNIVGCLDKPTSGTARILGNPVLEMNDRQISDLRGAHIGFVFQSFNLIPVLSAYENIEYPLLLARVPSAERRKRVTQMIERTGLGGLGHRRPSQLSGGQQQRVAVGRALVTHPRLVIADEPTGNLDSATGLMIIDLMKTLRDQHGSTLLFSTHDPALLKFPDRIYHLSDGRLARREEVQVNVANAAQSGVA
jgi:putative ABC transport system ATP-binding protein